MIKVSTQNKLGLFLKVLCRRESGIAQTEA